ncbi:MAG: monovalent cation/H+ antiporter subunit D family protein [Nitrospirae bacterium]|nr:monovalent cation/H+ antiporter subunit D family protein [Candidatus Manganitrophaceae bacterium]
MELESVKPLLAVMIPFIGGVFIVATRKNKNVREACSLVAGILMFFVVLSMIPAVLDGKTLHYVLFDFWPTVPIGFRVDGLGLLFALVAAFTWILTTLYSIGYMRGLKEHSQTRFYFCFAVTLSATMGAAFSNNWFTLFLFYELITFFTYPLVVHHETKEAWAGGNKYLFYLLATSKLFMAVAMLLTYYYSGSLDFTATGILPADVESTTLMIIFFLYLFGIAKAALMPFSAWLPASMVAPTPVSALLHAVAVVNTGAFCILRVVLNTFGVDLLESLDIGSIAVYLASFTIIMASVYAMSRDNLKERIAYSTVSQLSYMILGGVLLTSSGLTGGILHIANHAIAKITLFFCAGSIYVATKKTHVSQLNGIGRKMPWTMGAFAIATLSMIGVPPSGGFLSKWFLSLGAIEANQVPIVFVLLVSGLLNAIYFLPIVHRAFFKVPDEELTLALAGDKDGVVLGAESSFKEPMFCVIPLCITAATSILLGIFPDLLLDLTKQVIG